MVYRAYFDIPDRDKKHFKGSSPVLTDKLIEELQGASSIYISFFLFNNPGLQKELEILSRTGCKVKIYSLPLQGYDKRKLTIYKNNYKESFLSSKFEYASKIYKRIEENENIELKLFPHTYVWYTQKFSRGKEAYSLHNKSILASFPEGSFKCISSSCNFALGDPPHSENFLVVENCLDTLKMFKVYFTLLDKHTFIKEEYYNFAKENYDFQYIVKPFDCKDEFKNCYFTAPFIKYDGIGSNHYVQSRIVKFLNEAKNKIYICSQHFSNINPFDRKSLSIVEELAKIKQQKPDIKVKILKQTRAKDQAQGKRTQETEEFLSKVEGVDQKFWKPIIHDKFIIVDDQVLVSTANFTSTQFAWKEGHKMKYEVSGAKKTYEVYNTFSEINSFHFIEDKQIVTSYENHFNNLWDQAQNI
ncbi:phospholipase D-like domain-containing protein [Niallia sp. 03133]|uniref:phospholipase D-like domain-containing protein n=1 Tax=Niallia sp. 03133 TaxID=3458060 RepID=UPI004044512A